MSDTRSLPPDFPLTVVITMPAQRWEVLLRELGDARIPYVVAAPLIAEIQRQASAQLAARDDAMPPRGNGAELRANQG